MPIGKEGESQYAHFGGLQSPTCMVCFEVNDYSINSAEELMMRSQLRRIEEPEKVTKLFGHDEWKQDKMVPVNEST